MENRPSRRINKLGAALFCLALLFTVLGAFHVMENWRGKKKWEAYKRQLIGQGAKLDLAAFIPPLIPREQNFAATPAFADLFPGKRFTNWTVRWPETFGKVRDQISTTNKPTRHLTDFVAWQSALRAHTGVTTNEAAPDRAKAAQELLVAFKAYDPVLNELRAVKDRPQSRFDIHYNLENPWGIFLPHLPALKQLSQFLSVKACAELAAGHSDHAMEDVRLMLRIADSMERELFLINYLVRLVCFELALQPVWEGLVLERWSDAQLEELQRTMLRFNFVADVETPLGAERAAGILTAELLLKQRNKWEWLQAFQGTPGGNTGFGNALSRLIPRGWYHLEQLEYTRLFQKFLLPGSDGTNRVVYPAVIKRNDKEMQRAFYSPWRPLLVFKHRFLGALMMPAIVMTQGKAAHAQVAAHQAAIACALERYRRKHGQYPAELALLAPEFISVIPHGVIGGKPMAYKAGKPLVLYSVGWNEKDDGGTPAPTRWAGSGDWVWTYPEPQ